MTRFAIRLLRVALIVLLLVAVLVQLVVPVWASAFGTTTPEVAYLVVPHSVAAVVFIGCGEAVLLAVWRLLSLVQAGVIFTDRAVRWVDRIIACAVAATALTAAVLIHMLGFVPGSGGPTVYFLAAAIAGGATFVLLMVVMKALLVSAVTDRTELDGVI